MPVALTVSNIQKAAATVRAEAVLIDPAGRTIGRAETDVSVDPLKTAEANMTIPVADPQRWSVDHPTLYRVETRLLRDGKAIDARATRIGFREIRFDAATGFYLNGVATKIRACASIRIMPGSASPCPMRCGNGVSGG